MTTVTVKRENGFIKSIQIKGHAQYAPPGKDIVCASVSTITQQTVYLLDLSNSRNVAVAVDGKRAIYEFIVKDNNKTTETEEVLLQGLYGMLKELSKQYPNNVEVIE